MLTNPRIPRRMLLVLACAVSCVSTGAYAQVAPCQGRKGGIDHCAGQVYVCANGQRDVAQFSCGTSTRPGFAVPVRTPSESTDDVKLKRPKKS